MIKLLFATLVLAAMFPCTVPSYKAAKVVLPVNCEEGDALTFPTWNIFCGDGITECVSMSVLGWTPGANGNCPTTSCTGPAFTIRVTYNGCAPAADCCPGGILVDVTGSAQVPVALGNNTVVA